MMTTVMMMMISGALSIFSNVVPIAHYASLDPESSWNAQSERGTLWKGGEEEENTTVYTLELSNERKNEPFIL
jgi:hypothetical protein